LERNHLTQPPPVIDSKINCNKKIVRCVKNNCKLSNKSWWD
jgi:hypothetical protein